MDIVTILLIVIGVIYFLGFVGALHFLKIFQTVSSARMRITMALFWCITIIVIMLQGFYVKFLKAD